MQRVIITGANGTGKSHLAHRFATQRPDLPVISFDSIKLTQNWVQRSEPEIEQALLSTIAKDQWILEGGPSLLHHALPRADCVIWLDPPEWIRAWQLFSRPWRHRGKTRPELPPGNIDWPWQQYRFAFHALKKRKAMINSISLQLSRQQNLSVHHIRSRNQLNQIVFELALSEPQGQNRS
ncbi:AAA family ATPase [Pseudovibrio japonicus]|uniref:AAA family ATPase n=1 Tax=Pseudovibrio japonicus TaxID=366534 RepID=UPI00167924A0|nr:AAA family ATPase [Pseudovibrio japonicus]